MNGPRHLIFLKADHFEPDDAGQVKDWVLRYKTVASRHRDSSGRMPQHTWFYWGRDKSELSELKTACDLGLGEVEVHVHHGNDTAQNLTDDLRERMRLFAEAGLRRPGEPARFGFAHGFWSLDNAAGSRLCGVNNELQVLKETGCYADFTFPADRTSQPEKTNSIYYAMDDPSRPKSYNDGIDVEVNKQPSGDLMIFQGPGTISGYSKWGLIPGAQRVLERLRVYTDVSRTAVPTPVRIRNWVIQNVHVKGMPEWVFVKCHQHGARRADYPYFFGPAAEHMYSCLEHTYNDGAAWSLHYVSAREAYNIVKAAEAGKKGDPDDYRDYLVPPYRLSNA